MPAGHPAGPASQRRPSASQGQRQGLASVPRQKAHTLVYIISMKFEGVIYPSGLDIRRDHLRGYYITARTNIPAGSNIIKASNPLLPTHLRGQLRSDHLWPASLRLMLQS